MIVNMLANTLIVLMQFPPPGSLLDTTSLKSMLTPHPASKV